MQIHELKRNTPNKRKKIVGRGGKRGKTSGRGMKGQKARAGSKLRPEMRDIIKKLPKKRGYKFNSIATKPTPVNVAAIDAAFDNGATVSPETLVEQKVIKKQGGKMPAVKILGTGDIATKVTVTNCTVSDSAKEKIEKAGGSISQ